jgi:predicted nucleic acid-binding protein
LISVAEISRVEVAAAFAILVRRNEIPPTLGKRAFQEFTDEIDEEYSLVRLTPEIIRHATDLTQRHPLKAYDAVQLATALAFHESLRAQGFPLIFVSGDDRLVPAAETEGLATDNPFNHVDLDEAKNSKR